MTQRLDKLRQKLRAREGIPGYEKNVEEIRRQIAAIETVSDDSRRGLSVSENQTEKPRATRKRKRYRSAESGQFVKREVAEENPAITVSETIKPVASRSSEG